jgi:ornithine cyclodeaminase
MRIKLGPSLLMAGRVGDHIAVKAVSTVPGNPVGIVVVFDHSGSPVGTVDGPTLTALRTGAVSGLATRLLAIEEARTLAMLGAGAMAFDQVDAVVTVRPIERVVVWSRHKERAEDLARRVGGEVADAPAEAVAIADVVSCATPSTVALFRADAAPAHVHVNAVGAFTPHMVEVPAALLNVGFVVVDDIEAAAAEAGDLISADRDPDATLSEVLAGVALPTRRPTIFKSVGIAPQDVAAAVAELENAKRLGIGSSVG